jgi:hypothetical protein
LAMATTTAVGGRRSAATAAVCSWMDRPPNNGTFRSRIAIYMCRSRSIGFVFQLPGTREHTACDYNCFVHLTIGDVGVHECASRLLLDRGICEEEVRFRVG